MCLTIPKLVIAAKKGSATLKAGNKTETAFSLLKVKKGDWVLTQENMIIKKIASGQAKEILKIING